MFPPDPLSALLLGAEEGLRFPQGYGRSVPTQHGEVPSLQRFSMWPISCGRWPGLRERPQTPGSSPTPGSAGAPGWGVGGARRSSSTLTSSVAGTPRPGSCTCLLPSQVPPLTWSSSYLRAWALGTQCSSVDSGHRGFPGTGAHPAGPPHTVCSVHPSTHVQYAKATVGMVGTVSGSGNIQPPALPQGSDPEKPQCTKGPEDRRSQAPHNEAPQNHACPICNLFFTRISPPINLDFKLDCKHLERSRDHTSTPTATSGLRYSPGGGN